MKTTKLLLAIFFLIASVTEIGAAAFLNNSALVTVSFANNSALDELGDSAFENTAITEITLPNVSKTGRYCFSGCKNLAFLSLGNMNFDDGNAHGLTRILGYLFECSETEREGFVNIKQGFDSPRGWETLSFNVPAALKTVELRGNVYESGFDNCTMIEKLILRGVSSVHTYGLSGCPDTMTVYFEGDASRWSNAYDGDFEGEVVYIEENEAVV